VRAVVVPHRRALGWELTGLARAMRDERLDGLLTWTERLTPAVARRAVVWLFELPTHRIRQNRSFGAPAYQLASDLVTGSLWKQSLRRAARVVAGSHATAAELEDAVPGLRGRTTVVYPGRDERFTPGPGRPGRYVFHVASPDPRDNTSAVLAAHALLGDGTQLLVAGDLERQELAGGDGVELLGRVSDDELVRLYRGAACFLDASLYEGFGYQPLEAMACGTPVVASNTTSIPEVVGEAGLLCDPRSPSELAAALRRVLTEPELAAELSRRGLERAARFSWERTARGLAAVLEEAFA
jgi:alpha-1,3-rhamnosyl/mannosyltransferase